MKLITIFATALTVSLLLIGCSGGGGSGGSSSGGGNDNRSGDSGIVDGDGNGGDNRSGDGGIIDGDGNGGDNRSGDGGIIDGDGNGGELNIPAQAEWTIVPLAGGLSIQWHNLNNFTQMNALQRLSINLTRSDTSVKQTHTIDISDFINGIYQLTGLEDGIAYKFASMIELEYGGNISHSRPISLLLEFNRLDNIGNGIVVGANHDGDGRTDGVDTDDDNDGKPDDMDACRLGEIGWNSDNTTLDYDSDGCRNDEDIDDDGDGLIEIGTAAELDAVRYVLDGTGFKANETAMLDQTGCGDGVDMMVCNGYELVGNISLTGYIARTNPTAGWQPIAHDINPRNLNCEGDRFTAIFDGNGFEVRGLFINRSTEDCIGLFGQVAGTIRHLGVVADKVEGSGYVGGLVGRGTSASIVQSYAVSNSVVGGRNSIGGLVGDGTSASIIQSYAVSGSVNTAVGISASDVGGLVGTGVSASIIQSYAVSGAVRVVGSAVGGLVGAVSSVGVSIVQSYAVSGSVSGSLFVGGLVGLGGIADVSYWDTETSGRNNDGPGVTGSSGQTSSALYSPTGYTDIYDAWDEGLMVDAINDNATIWCDEDQSGVIEDEERRGAGDTNGDNRVWDFGTATDYPALRCTGDSLAEQRAWWHLNASHKPELNQTRLDAYIDGTLP